MEFLHKSLEQLTPAEIVRLFIADCLLVPREPRKLPASAAHQLLTLYCNQLGVAVPSTTALGLGLKSQFKSVKSSGSTHYICAIRPGLIPKEGTHD